MIDTAGVNRRVLCIAGSLRSASSNRAALQAAGQLAPASLDLVLFAGMGALPWFNPDAEVDPLPAPVVGLREAVGCADALLIACPEYAHGIPGAFKNLLDWLVGSTDFPGKPVLLLNCSARASHHAQDALVEVLKTMSARLLSPEPFPVRLPGAGTSAKAVLASGDRRRELQIALGCLAAGLMQACG